MFGIDSAVNYVITGVKVSGFLVFRDYQIYVGVAVGVGRLYNTPHIVLYAQIEQHGAAKYGVTLAVYTAIARCPAAGGGTQQLGIAVYRVLEVPKKKLMQGTTERIERFV